MVIVVFFTNKCEAFFVYFGYFCFLSTSVRLLFVYWFVLFYRQIALREGPPILYGKNPTDLPNYDLGHYQTGSETIVGCYSGPDGGLTTVRRVEKHLSVLDADIDFIDTPQPPPEETGESVAEKQKRPVDNTTMVIKVAGQEYCVTNNKKRNSKSQSLDDLSVENNNSEDVRCKNVVAEEKKECCEKNFALAKSKSEGNPFEHKKRGKIKRLAQRPAATGKHKAARVPCRSFLFYFIFCMVLYFVCACALQ